MRSSRYRLCELPGYALLLIAPPIALAGLAGSPLPEHQPTHAEWQALLREPMTWPVIVATATTAAWLLWAGYAATVAMELYRWAIRGRRLPRLSIPGPMRALSAAVLGATALSATSSAVAHAATAPADAGTGHPDTTRSDDRHRIRTVPTTAHPAHIAGVPRPRTDAGSTDRPAVYVVQRGDWLSAVAARYLGDPDRYPDIAALNRHLIPDPAGPDGPDWIHPGERYQLPADAHDHGPRRHATGSATPAPKPAPADHAPAEPDDRSPHQPEPPNTHPVDPDGVTDTPDSTPAPTGPHRPATPAADGSRPDGGGVSVPSGWLTLPLAIAVAAAAAITWRRRRTELTAPGGGRPASSPPTSTPPPRRPRPAAHHPVTAAPSTPAEASKPTATANPDQTDPTTDHDVSPLELFGLAASLPPHGLGLDGPGAHSAARALLLAAATAAATSPDGAEVVASTDTLTTILGTTAAPTPGLHLTATPTHALRYLLERIIDRRRTHDDLDLDEPNPADNTPRPEPIPPILLLAHTPTAQQRDEMINTLRLGATVNVHAVLLGAWEGGETATVQADGHTNRTGERLAVLDVATTMRLLRTINAAHQPEPGQPNLEPSSTADPGVEPANHRPAQTVTAPASPREPGDAAATGPQNTITPPSTPAESSPSDPLPAPPAPTEAVRIHLFGPLVIIDRDGHENGQLRHHARQLLIYLAVHRSGANLPDIMEVIWPNATLRRAGERLATEVADLRRRIRQAAGNPHLQPVINTGGRYHLNPAVVDLDIWRFTDTLHRAETADPTARTTALAQAVDIHTGPLAQGQDYDWIDRPREHLDHAGIRARRELADLLTETDPARAAALTAAAAALAPADEDIARQAMRALARTGNTGAIAAQLQQLQQALHALDEPVSEQTTALAAQLLRDTRREPPDTPDPAG